jgi:hypothetical protein
MFLQIDNHLSRQGAQPRGLAEIAASIFTGSDKSGGKFQPAAGAEPGAIHGGLSSWQLSQASSRVE